MGDEVKKPALGEHLLESFAQGDLVSWGKSIRVDDNRVYGIILKTYVDSMITHRGAVGEVGRVAAYAKVIDSNGTIDVQLLSSLRKESQK